MSWCHSNDAQSGLSMQLWCKKGKKRRNFFFTAVLFFVLWALKGYTQMTYMGHVFIYTNLKWKSYIAPTVHILVLKTKKGQKTAVFWSFFTFLECSKAIHPHFLDMSFSYAQLTFWAWFGRHNHPHNPSKTTAKMQKMAFFRHLTRYLCSISHCAYRQNMLYMQCISTWWLP